MNEFDGLNSPDEWMSKLRELLAAAQTAAKSADVDERFKVAERLTIFVERSFPNNEIIRALDQVAGKAAVGLLEATIDERLQSIVARNAELSSLSKEFESAAGAAENAAASIRLERVVKAFDSITRGAAALKELRSSLQEGVDDKMIATIDRADEVIRVLKAMLEKA